MTSTDSGPMRRLDHTADQLRWPLTGTLYLALDAHDQIVAEVLGQRAIVPDARDLAEAARQAYAQQGSASRPAGDQVLAARTAELAARSRHDMIRQYIQTAASRQLADSNGRLGIDHYARDIADDAMTSIGSVLTQAIAAGADDVIRNLAGSPGWREILDLGVRHADHQHAAELYEFAQAVGALPQPDPETDETAAALADVIAQARQLTRRGDSEGGHLPALAPGDISPNGHGPAAPAGE